LADDVGVSDDPVQTLVRGLRRSAAVEVVQAAGSVPTIDVEGYVDGDLRGGIEIQLAPPEIQQRKVYLPLVLRSG